VISLGSEALLLLSKELSSGLISVDEKDTSTSRSQCDDFLSCQRPQMMKIMLSKRLAENPKTLIILDGVLLQETVDLFAGLDVRFSILNILGAITELGYRLNFLKN
jgi:hypothetical protein